MYRNREGGVTIVRRRTYLPWLILFFAAALIAAWSFEALGGEPRAVTASAAGSAEQLEQKLDELVFPKDRVIDVRITVSEEDFEDMLDNAAAEKLKPASVGYNGIKLDNIVQTAALQIPQAPEGNDAGNAPGNGPQGGFDGNMPEGFSGDLPEGFDGNGGPPDNLRDGFVGNMPGGGFPGGGPGGFQGAQGVPGAPGTAAAQHSNLEASTPY